MDLQKTRRDNPCGYPKNIIYKNGQPRGIAPTIRRIKRKINK